MLPSESVAIAENWTLAPIESAAPPTATEETVGVGAGTGADSWRHAAAARPAAMIHVQHLLDGTAALTTTG